MSQYDYGKRVDGKVNVWKRGYQSKDAGGSWLLVAVCDTKAAADVFVQGITKPKGGRSGKSMVGGA